jgi:hypothetical protein
LPVHFHQLEQFDAKLAQFRRCQGGDSTRIALQIIVQRLSVESDCQPALVPDDWRASNGFVGQAPESALMLRSVDGTFAIDRRYASSIHAGTNSSYQASFLHDLDFGTLELLVT